MPGLPLDVLRSFRYARTRARTLLALRDESPLFPIDLARAADLDLKTLRWVMHGKPPRYRRERSLVPLGLVREVHDSSGMHYELTTHGRRMADAVLAEQEERRKAARRAGA